MKIQKINCEICKIQTSLDEHHIHSKSKGGSNDSYNKCRICPNCHRQVHYGEIIIEGRFQSTAGNIIVYRNKDEDSITGFSDPPVWIYGTVKTENLLLENHMSNIFESYSEYMNELQDLIL